MTEQTPAIGEITAWNLGDHTAHEDHDPEAAIAEYSAALIRLANAPDPLAEYELRSSRAAACHRVSDYITERADLERMAELAHIFGDQHRQIAVVIRQVALANLLGEAAMWRAAAEQALVRAGELGNTALQADCQHVLGEADYYLAVYDRAETHLLHALALYRQLGDQNGAARSLRSLSGPLVAVNRQLQARECLEAAQAIYHALGDHTEEAHTLIFQGLITVDTARRRNALEEALQHTAGYSDRQVRARLLNSLGNLYAFLGLYKRSHEYVTQAVALARTLQLRLNLTWYLDSLGHANLGLGAFDAAYVSFEECAALTHAIGDQSTEAYAWLGMGRAALARQQPTQARDLCQRAADQFTTMGQLAERSNALAHLAAAQLALNDLAAALTCTAEAVTIIDQGHLSSDFYAHESWWWRYQALRAANADDQSCWHAIQRAYELMLSGLEDLNDVGLRRNYLNKVEVNRAILIAWIHEATRQGIVATQAHGPTIDIEEQLIRMLAIGTHMNEQRESAALHAFLLDQLIELCGAERALLMFFPAETALASGTLAAYWGLAFQEAKQLCTQVEPLLLEVARIHQPQVRQDVPDPLETGAEQLPGLSHSSALAIPLMAGTRLMGVLYADVRSIYGRFEQADLRLLAVFASQATTALENARLYEESLRANLELEQRVAERTATLEQRNADLAAANARLEQRSTELTMLNSVQQGLAAQLDMQEIFELVGDKIRDIFDAQVVDISLYDSVTGLVHSQYWIERGVRFSAQPMALIGIPKHVIETRQPLLINSDMARARRLYDNPIGMWGGEPSKSAVIVPFVVGGEAKGYISLADPDREHAFSELDVRLLSTLAASMSVALENARLFDQTRRLLVETEERNTELAAINTIQQSLAWQLDFQAIIDLVGHQISQVFDADVVYIALHNSEMKHIRFPFYLEQGEREHPEPVPYGQGLTSIIMQSRQPLLLGTFEQQRALGVLSDGQPAESWLGVPILLGDDSLGVVSVQHYKQHMYNERDIRLLSTLAASMSVALENARLFDEGKRLLAETEQRNIELTLINSLQQSFATQLDFQTICNLVGDKIYDTFHAQVVDMGIYDRTTGLLSYPYWLERGERYASEPTPLFGIRKHIIETGQLLHINHDWSRWAQEYNNPLAFAGEVPKSVLFVPLVAGEQAIGYISLQNLDREHAFSDSDMRLLSTLAASMSMAIENARLFDQTKRLLAETEQRAADLETVNRIGQALASELKLEALIELTGEQIRQTFAADIAYVALHDSELGLIRFPYYYEHGTRTYDQTMPYGIGLTSQIITTSQPLVLNHQIEEFEARTGFQQVGTRVKSYLGVPIMAGQQAIGVISVQNTEAEGRFSNDDTRLLATIAANVGVAIENARLYREAQRRAQETAALAEVGREISASLDLPIVLERIAARALELLNGRDVALRLLEADGRLPAVVTLGKYAAIYQAWDVSLGQGMTGHIAQSGIAEMLNDPVNDPRVAPVPGTEPDDPTEAMIFAPLLVGQTIIGVLTVWRDKTVSGPFVQSDLDFVVGLARQAAIAIENARLFAEIRRQKQFSDALLEASPVAIIQEDLREHVTAWNPAAQRLFGYTPEEAIGRHLDDLVANRPDIRQDADRYTRATQPPKGPGIAAAHGIGRRTRKDGQLVDVEFFGVSVIVDGQDVAGITLYHDITELQKARQEAIAANLAKSTFLANMSHELRTPLNAVLGFTQVLERDSALTSRQREHLAIISRSGEHLLGLINDVLEVSKIEAGRLILHTAPFDLPALFHNIVELFRLSASAKSLDLIAEVAADLPQYVHGDESKLRQVLINLLGNAVKFTHTGGVTLRAAYQIAETPTLLVEVADTGEGIAENQIARLFEAFSQTDSGLHAQESSGLGLAISRQYVQLMGGIISATSQPGEGSVFRFTVPLPLADALEPRRAAERRVIALAPNQGEYRLLVVDDKWESRKLLVTWLQDVGFAVREASNGEEAIAMWEEWSPQLIWMDVRMPVLDGYEATRRIKATLKGQATVIIALTASAFDHERTIVLSAGCDDFVRKPVREAVIFAKLAEYLGVHFVYADSAPALVTAQPSILAADALAALPPTWITAMYTAVSGADMDEIRALTEQIQGQNAALAEHLGWLRDNFQIDQLLQLLQTAEQRRAI